MIKLVLIATILMAGTVFAGERKEVLLSETQTELEIALNNQTVKCSQADYQLPFLKVLIPELSRLTIFNHRNFGEGAPCVAAGACAPFGEAAPSDILDELKPTETVVVKISLTKVLVPNEEKQVCHVILKEDVLTNIRGVDFIHSRQQSIGDRVLSDCQ